MGCTRGWRGCNLRQARAFSSEVDSGSRQENASNQKSRAVRTALEKSGNQNVACLL
jgi:hypothetical protein